MNEGTQHNRVVEPKMNSHQIIFIQFSNNEGSKSQQFLGGGWRHLNDHVWKRSPGHDTNDVIMGGFDAQQYSIVEVQAAEIARAPIYNGVNTFVPLISKTTKIALVVII